jgi:GDPmannose 4,6-dehydratase
LPDGTSRPPQSRKRRTFPPADLLATNETHTVREFVEKAFAHVDLDWREFVRHDKRYERPAEVELLIGNPVKAKKNLGWEPKVRFEELIRIMVDADLSQAKRSTGKAEAHRL